MAGREGGMFTQEGEAHHFEGMWLVPFANFIARIESEFVWSVQQLLVVKRYPLR